MTASAIDAITCFLATGLADGSVLVWNMHTGVEAVVFERHAAAVTALAYCRSRGLVSGAEDRSVHVCDMGDTELLSQRVPRLGATAASVAPGQLRPRLVRSDTSTLQVRCVACGTF